LEVKLTEEEVMQKEKHNLANKGEVNSNNTCSQNISCIAGKKVIT
jgi:hypothetical protein